MKTMIGLSLLLLVTGCACSKETKREKVLAKALAETRLRYDYAADQNERYSKQVKKLTKASRKRK